ncbi:membrane protein insertase YidC [bacterium]|nr:membrane protein insertase YidC [bacterium]
MQKRMILAIFLSALVLFFYNHYYFQYISPKKISPKKETALSTKNTKEIPSPEKTTTFLLKGKKIVSPQEIPILDIPLNIPPEKLTVKTNLIEAKISPYGNIYSFELNKYLANHDKVLLVKKIEGFTGPLSTTFQTKNLVLKDFNSINNYEKEFIYLDPGNPEIKLIKRYVFYPEKYSFDLCLTLQNNTSSNLQANNLALSWNSSNIGLIDKGTQAEKNFQSYFKNGKMDKVKYKGEGFLEKVSAMFTGQKEDWEEIKTCQLLNNISWVAESDQYFTLVIVPEGEVNKVVFNKDIKNKMSTSIYLNDKIISPHGDFNFKFKIYLGPKKFEELKALSKNVEDLSELNSIALILLWALKSLYKWCHNYGVAIILLTILIKIILYPLTAKGLKSMKEMSKIQPKLAELKEKYKDNKEKFNQELMLLYKKYKVNPLGGCLPLILQIPVFYALFNALNAAIELRNAKFIFWWQDLSQKDPYYILPILMGATMIIQQKMTPTTDPTQAKIMLWMPVVFTVMFLNFPAGLMLYWIVQNILSIGQQYLIMRSEK